MKKLLVVLAAMAFLMVSATVALADTQDVGVSANIAGTCQFISAAPVEFGPLDQTSSADATAAGSVSFWCTNNALYTLTDEDGLGEDGAFSGTLIGSGSDTITYSLLYNNTSGSGSGKTTPIVSTINGTILNAAYIDVEAGSYTETVTFTIAP